MGYIAWEESSANATALSSLHTTYKIEIFIFIELWLKSLNLYVFKVHIPKVRHKCANSWLYNVHNVKCLKIFRKDIFWPTNLSPGFCEFQF